jgi:hypothetical protein
MPDLAKLNHELSQEISTHAVYWGIDKKDKKVIGIVGRFLRIIHYGKTIQQNLRDEYN